MKNIKPIGYIFKTTCLINNFIYIGQTTKEIGTRKEQLYLGSGSDFKIDFKKYGRSNFKKEILKFCFNQKELNVWEIILIKKNKSNKIGIGYNILSTLAINWKSNSGDPRVKLKISQANKGKLIGDENPMRLMENRIKFMGDKNPNYKARSFTQGTRNKISIGKSKWLLSNPDKNPMRNPITKLYNILIRCYGYKKGFVTKLRADLMVTFNSKQYVGILEI